MTSGILIVEDELIVARDLQLILQKAGYQVSGIARSVKKAQELMRQEKPALVLLDICLSGKETGQRQVWRDRQLYKCHTAARHGHRVHKQ